MNAAAANEHDASPRSAFYRRALALMLDAEIPFLIGGAFALQYYTGLSRDTKDIDIFIKADDVDRTLAAFDRAGYRTELPYPHWLAKVRCGQHVIDIIFSSGNGLAVVDDEWFAVAPGAELLGMTVKLSPVEEMIWSKAFVMERERFDGADIAHLLHAKAGSIDWQRLLRRFDDHWPVLLSHLVLFNYIYPSERRQIPDWVVRQLVEKLLAGDDTGDTDAPVCRGTYLSRAQYLPDIIDWNYQDARVEPGGPMTAEQTDIWTTAALEDDNVIISIVSEPPAGDSANP